MTTRTTMTMKIWRRSGWANDAVPREMVSASQRVCGPGVRESRGAQPATVAVPTRRAARAGIVTTVRQAVVKAQPQSQPDDLRLGEIDQRRVNGEGPAFHAGLGRQPRQVLEGADVLGTAVGIAGVVERVDADENVRGANHLRP